jgi:hypothetical protein
MDFLVNQEDRVVEEVQMDHLLHFQVEQEIARQQVLHKEMMVDMLPMVILKEQVVVAVLLLQEDPVVVLEVDQVEQV